ncbi:hypothetical protein ACIBCR_16285 [Micromonospora echinospora]|uniref:hypothetical protein n=1 Tax=Micromonospora echinospora TaxID=1877 RepID=UPI0037B633DF
MLTTTILAAAQEPERGWGGPVALLVAVAAFYVIISVHHRIQEARERRANPSPTPPTGRGVSDTTQVRAVSDTDDTARDTEPDTGWWGRIVESGGRRFRVYDQPAAAAEPADDEVDVALDDDEHDEPEEETETIEDVIALMLDRGHQYAEIVRHVMEEFEVSEATAKRRIRDVRAERIAAAS